MAKIIGNTTATPNPRPDWNQTDETKADYIKNKPNVVTQEVDPTVPAWAKEPTKPTYTAEEVGALPEDTTLAEMPDDVDHRTVSDNEKTTWNEKFDKAGGTITGNVAITGDLTVNGTTFSEDHETIVVEDNMMVLNSNKVDLQTAVSGIAMNKNADSTYGAVYDPVDDTFKFGEGTLNEANEFEFNDGEGLPFAVREDSTQFADGHIVEWSTDGNKLVDSGKTVEDFSLDGHGHIIDDVEKLQETLDTKAVLGEELVNTDVVYIKNVPNISAPYAAISKIGGLTRKCTNFAKPKVSHEWGCSASFADDDKLTLTTTVAYDSIFATAFRAYLYKGVTYTVALRYLNNIKFATVISPSSANIATIYPSVQYATITANESGYYTINVYQPDKSAVGTVSSCYVQINEGATILSHEPYFEGLRDARVTQVNSSQNRTSETISIPYQKQTVGGVTITVNEDATITLNGTVTSEQYPNIDNLLKKTSWVSYDSLPFAKYKRYRLAIDVISGSYSNANSALVALAYYDTQMAQKSIGWYNNTVATDNDVEKINSVYLALRVGTVFNNLTYSVKILADDTALEIPEAVQNKEWYGIGIPNTEYYNSIDLKNGKGDIKAKEIVLNGTENFLISKLTDYHYFYVPIGDVGVKPNTDLLCDQYDSINESTRDKTCFVGSGGVAIRDDRFTTANDFKTYLAEQYANGTPVTLICAMATPETEDISDLITDDNLIGVEGGGTLMFENEYEYDVPSEVMFYLNNNKEISANEFIGDLKGKALWADHAEQATNADHSNHSNHSDEADHAEQADYAKFDSNGNIIADTYTVLSEELINNDITYVKDVPNESASYVEINKIGGMSYKSKNLFGGEVFADKLVSFGGTKNTSNGTVYITAGNASGKIAYANFKENTQYTFIIKASVRTVGGVNFKIYYTDGTTFVMRIETANTPTTIRAVSTSGKTVESFKGEWQADTTYYYNECGIFEGNLTINDFEPYFDGFRDAKVTAVKSVGVNLFDKDNVINKTYIDLSNGKLATEDVDGWYTSQPIPVSNAQYVSYKGENASYGAIRYRTLDGNGNVINIAHNGNYSSGKVSISSDEKFIQFCVRNNNLKIFQVNYGTEALPYTPYTEHTLAIPKAVQSLEGYGLGIDEDCYNCIDLENQKLNLICAKDTWNGAESNITYVSATGLFRLVLSNNAIKDTSGVCNSYGVYVGAYQYCPDQHFMVAPTSITNDKNVIFVKDSRFTTAEAFKAHLASNNLSVVYMLEAPVIEDISEIIPLDNLIGVEGGGTVTFENEYGYDVPSEVKFRLNNNDKVSAETFVGDLIGTSSRTISDEDGRSLKNNYASTGTSEIVESDTLFVDIPNDEQLANNVKISKIGGMSRKCTNLLQLFEINGDIAGVTVHTYTDGTFSIKGTATASGGRNNKIGQATLKAGTYKLNSQISNLAVSNSTTNAYIAGLNTFTLTEETTVHVGFNFTQGEIYNATGTIWLNEGVDILPYEPYFEGLRHAKVTAVKSVGVNMVKQPYSFGSQTIQGVTITVNSDNSITFNGTATGDIALNMGQVYLRKDVSYTINGLKNFTEAQALFYVKTGRFFDTLLINSNGAVTKTCLKDGMAILELYIYRGTTIKQTVYPMLNEGTEALPYSPYTEHTIPIPENIQNLEGYGLGINDTLYNYIDFESKKFNRAVGKVDLATLVWTLEPNEGNFYWYTKSILDIKYVNANTEVGVGLWENGIIRMGSGMYLSVKGELAIDVSRISCNNGSSTEKPTGILVYALATPTIEDIAIANIVGVEGGGTIEFVNEYNYDINSTLEFYYGKKDRIHIDEVVGNLSGTAKKAELAERDNKGNIIADTYFSKNNLNFTTNNNAKHYKVQADANNNLYVNVPWEGGGEGADGNYYHIPDYSTGLKIATGSGVADMYVPIGVSEDTVAIGNHNHDDRYYTENEINDKLSIKLDSLSDMTKFPVSYGFAIGREGNTVGVSNGPDNYYLLLDSTNTLRTGIQLNGASDVSWQEVPKVNHTHDYLPLTGGTIYSSNSTTDTPLRIRAKNTDSFVSFHNETGTYLAGIGVRSDKKPYVYTSERGYEEILTTSGGTMTGEITIGQGDGNGIQLGKLGYINATNNDGSAKTCTILGVNASQEYALVGHPQFNLQLRGSGDAPMYNNKTIIHSGNIGEQSVAKAVRSWAMYVTDRRDETLTPDYFDDKQISTFFSNTDCPDGAWKSGITVKGWNNDYKSWQLFSNSDNNDTDNSLYFRSGRNTSWHPWRKIIDSSNIGSQNVLGAYLLNNFYSTRPATANLAVAGDGSVKTFKSTSSMTEGHPVAYGTSSTGNGEGHILHFEWDNAGGYSGQIFLGNGPADSMQYRVMNNKQWHPWVRLIDSNNIDSYALPLYGGTLTNSLILNNGGTGESPALIFRRGEFRDNTTDWRLFVNNGNLYFSFANAVNGWNDSVYIKDQTNIIVGNLEGSASYANSAGSVAWENVSDKPPICTISEVQALLDNFAATNILNAAY